jgi:hypothetical protein
MGHGRSGVPRGRENRHELDNVLLVEARLAAIRHPVHVVGAAAKKLRERPDDKDALQELERAVHRLKAKQSDGSEATKP